MWQIGRVWNLGVFTSQEGRHAIKLNCGKCWPQSFWTLTHRNESQSGYLQPPSPQPVGKPGRALLQQKRVFKLPNQQKTPYHYWKPVRYHGKLILLQKCNPILCQFQKVKIYIIVTQKSGITLPKISTKVGNFKYILRRPPGVRWRGKSSHVYSKSKDRD